MTEDLAEELTKEADAYEAEAKEDTKESGIALIIIFIAFATLAGSMYYAMQP